MFNLPGLYLVAKIFILKKKIKSQHPKIPTNLAPWKVQHFHSKKWHVSFFLIRNLDKSENIVFFPNAIFWLLEKGRNISIHRCTSMSCKKTLPHFLILFKLLFFRNFANMTERNVLTALMNIPDLFSFFLINFAIVHFSHTIKLLSKFR